MEHDSAVAHEEPPPKRARLALPSDAPPPTTEQGNASSSSSSKSSTPTFSESLPLPALPASAQRAAAAVEQQPQPAMPVPRDVLRDAHDKHGMAMMESGEDTGARRHISLIARAHQQFSMAAEISFSLIASPQIIHAMSVLVPTSPASSSSSAAQSRWLPPPQYCWYLEDVRVYLDTAMLATKYAKNVGCIDRAMGYVQRLLDGGLVVPEDVLAFAKQQQQQQQPPRRSSQNGADLQQVPHSASSMETDHWRPSLDNAMWTLRANVLLEMAMTGIKKSRMFWMHGRRRRRVITNSASENNSSRSSDLFSNAEEQELVVALLRLEQSFTLVDAALHAATSAQEAKALYTTQTLGVVEFIDELTSYAESVNRRMKDFGNNSTPRYNIHIALVALHIVHRVMYYRDVAQGPTTYPMMCNTDFLRYWGRLLKLLTTFTNDESYVVSSIPVLTHAKAMNERQLISVSQQYELGIDAPEMEDQIERYIDACILLARSLRMFISRSSNDSAERSEALRHVEMTLRNVLQLQPYNEHAFKILHALRLASDADRRSWVSAVSTYHQREPAAAATAAATATPTAPARPVFDPVVSRSATPSRLAVVDRKVYLVPEDGEEEEEEAAEEVAPMQTQTRPGSPKRRVMDIGAIISDDMRMSVEALVALGQDDGRQAAAAAGEGRPRGKEAMQVDGPTVQAEEEDDDDEEDAEYQDEGSDDDDDDDDDDSDRAEDDELGGDESNEIEESEGEI